MKDKAIPNGSLLDEIDEIYTEAFYSTNFDANLYSENNFTYKEEAHFAYDFEHIIKEGER